jgi:predicted nucleic acid-binding protein
VIGVVVDASVAVKWLAIFETETYLTQAKAIIDQNRRGELSLLVPDLFWAEIGSALCKAVRRQACNADEARAALATLEEQSITTLPTLELMRPALDIALGYGRSIFDGVYVALARELNCELITADEKLANAVAGHLPVKWLGAI